MILQALTQYYDRLATDPNTDIAPLGFEQKEISFSIVLTDEGQFCGLRDLREGSGKKKKGRTTLVPKGVKRTVGVAANLLWDTAPYVLGRTLKGDKKAKLKYSGKGAAKRLDISGSKAELKKVLKRLPEQSEAFRSKIEIIFDGCDDVGIQAVLAFLKASDFSELFANPVWKDVDEGGGNITFALQNGDFICQRPEIVSKIIAQSESAEGGQVCAVTGRMDEVAILHTSIKGVWGAQAAGANIVSFNLNAFESFGKSQGNNAPIGKQAEFAYTTALNYLLKKENARRMQVGDASTVFWAQNPSDFEEEIISIFDQPKSGEESVKYDKIKGLLTAVKSGVPPEEENLPFYVLGLAPNASRISIRFWYAGNLKEMKERIAQFFSDIELIRPPKSPEFLSLLQLLSSTATEGKIDNLPPNISGDFIRAVLTGTAYPQTLLANALRRCKAEQKVTFARISIIKACLIRNSLKEENKEVSVALDKSYENIGYVLGRLFAVLERIQEQAQGGNLNKTIRDTYFGAATSSPMITFNRLDELSIHHLAKIRNGGKPITWLEKLKGEIYDIIPASGIPTIMNLEDQARFAVGYYHQRQDFFKAKETITDETTEKSTEEKGA